MIFKTIISDLDKTKLHCLSKLTSDKSLNQAEMAGKFDYQGTANIRDNPISYLCAKLYIIILRKDVVKCYSYSRDKNILFQASNIKDDDKIHFLLFQLALFHYFLQSKDKYIFHHVLQLHFQFCSYLFSNL